MSNEQQPPLPDGTSTPRGPAPTPPPPAAAPQPQPYPQPGAPQPQTPQYAPQASAPQFGTPYTQPAGQGLPPGVDITSPGLRFVAYLLEVVLVTVTLVIGWLIWAAIIAGGGQTPAKKLMGQRVIYADGRGPVGFATMLFLRGIVAGFVAFFAITFTLGILLLMPFWDKRNQNIWDKVSGTLVVNDRHNAWSIV